MNNDNNGIIILFLAYIEISLLGKLMNTIHESINRKSHKNYNRNIKIIN